LSSYFDHLLLLFNYVVFHVFLRCGVICSNK